LTASAPSKRLTRLDLTMIAIGASIGSGIFLTPSSIALALPAPAWIFGVWIAGGVLTLCGALSFAELGAMMPRSGGIYAYLSEAYGELVGFLYGWAYLLVVTTGSIAALAVAFATYAGYFVPLGPGGTRFVAFAALALVTVVNVLGVRAGAVMTDALTVLKLAGIAALVVVGLAFGSRSDLLATTAPALPSGLGAALGAGMTGVLWSYGGWQHATFPVCRPELSEASFRALSHALRGFCGQVRGLS
jgi:basic amino acid/polyamine antiporter, APA family